MEWNVYWYNWNKNLIEPYNVLKHREDFIFELKANSETKELFSKELDREMKYHYWSRCEYETVISGWIARTGAEEKKIDIYQQLKMNWDRFIDYCWNYEEN